MRGPCFLILKNLKGKRQVIQLANISSIEEDDNEDFRLVTYSVNSQVQRHVKVQESIDEIIAKINKIA